MKNSLYLLFAIITFAICINVSAANLNISSKYAVVYNLNENEIIYEKNANEITDIASLTKIMTAIVAIEHNNR